MEPALNKEEQNCETAPGWLLRLAAPVLRLEDWIRRLAGCEAEGLGAPKFTTEQPEREQFRQDMQRHQDIFDMGVAHAGPGKAEGLEEDLRQLIRVALTNPTDLHGFIQANYPKEYAKYPEAGENDLVKRIRAMLPHCRPAHIKHQIEGLLDAIQHTAKEECDA